MKRLLFAALILASPAIAQDHSHMDGMTDSMMGHKMPTPEEAARYKEWNAIANKVLDLPPSDVRKMAGLAVNAAFAAHTAGDVVAYRAAIKKAKAALAKPVTAKIIKIPPEIDAMKADAEYAEAYRLMTIYMDPSPNEKMIGLPYIETPELIAARKEVANFRQCKAFPCVTAAKAKATTKIIRDAIIFIQKRRANRVAFIRPK